MKISLLVIRCKDIEESKIFYEALGLSFTEEKHDNGPKHYSCQHDGCVFELYPNNGHAPLDNNRLGFKVKDINEIMSQLTATSSYNFNGKSVYIFVDPDGRKVEVTS